ncbi:MAG: RecX family transcriptional regulator [Anaerolineales bacterium]|nr:RecX family transcriptional regulator [Anaerolineales bacterium]
MKVTALRVQSRNKTRVNVYLDGKYAFGVAKVVAARLQIGQELDDAALANLRGLDDAEQAYERALKFLAPRPRSEAEVRRRLKQHGIEPALIDTVVERLREAGLLDDQAFANYWVDNRATFRPRSKRALRVELRQKGLSDAAVRAALDGLDDASAAHKVAAQRAGRLAGLGRDEFRRKLGDFLARRGFGYDIVEPVVERLWNEIGQPAAPDPGP